MINVQNLDSSQKNTKSKFTFSIGNLGKVERKEKGRTIPRDKKGRVLINKVIYSDNGRFFIYADKEQTRRYYLEVTQNLFCECEYMYSTPNNTYYPGRFPICRPNITQWEKMVEITDSWTLFVLGMKIKGYWDNDGFNIDTDSMNAYSKEYYLKHLNKYDHDEKRRQRDERNISKQR